MADDQTGEKTEPATAKRLRDARKRGDVPKSRDLGQAIGLIAILLVFLQLLEQAPERLTALTNATLDVSDMHFRQSLAKIGLQAVNTLVVLSAIMLVPVVIVGLLVQFIQCGPIMTAEKLNPRLSHLDPIAGFKRMFGADNWVELAKSIVYTAILLIIGWWVISANLGDILLTPTTNPVDIAAGMIHCLTQLFGWTVLVLALITAVDVAWQRHSFASKMKMSLRDIRDEHKNSEGDPAMKGQRQQLAQEWAREGSKKAAGNASVVVVNPTHIAIAVLYDEHLAPVPIITGRGENELAQEMRDAARAANVPVLRNEMLARALLRDTDDGDLVPRELFPIVAEVTLWARRVRERIIAEQHGGSPDDEQRQVPVPGEDLTHYPTMP